MGDLPDWQTFTAPAIVAASVIDNPASTLANILISGGAFRVWGVWVRMSLCTNAAYVAAILEVKTQILDGNGNVILEVACHVTAANQSQHDSLAIPVPGFTPALNTGAYAIQLKSDASAANVFYRASGGIYWSQP
jgi:hypothetical protein